MRVMTDADRDGLALLCDALAEYVAVRDAGTSWNNTADAWRRVNLMLQQFGMTPSSRAKVSTVGDAKDADPLDTFLGKSG